MPVTLTVPFEEHEDSPIERGDRESGFQFSRIFLVNYADRFVFLREMFIGGRVPGWPKAYHDAFPDLVCAAFDIERIVNRPAGPVSMTDPEQQIILHDTLAKITIEYKPIEFSEVREGTFATYTQGQSVEFIDLHGRGMQWQGAGLPLPADVKQVSPVLTTRHEVTWHQVTDPPWSLLSSLKGNVNYDAMLIPATGLVLPAETLLFAESSSRQTIRYDGQMATELTLIFLEKRQLALGGSATIGWNHKFNPDTGSYDRPVSSSGAPLFQPGNLLSIFA